MLGRLGMGECVRERASPEDGESSKGNEMKFVVGDSRGEGDDTGKSRE